MEVFSNQEGVQLYTANFLPDPCGNVRSSFWFTTLLIFFHAFLKDYSVNIRQWKLLRSRRRSYDKVGASQCVDQRQGPSSVLWRHRTRRKRRSSILEARSILFGNTEVSRCCSPRNVAKGNLPSIRSNIFYFLPSGKLPFNNLEPWYNLQAFRRL